jgi:ATP-binding cassette subfamily C (CFTR/MRP) protein 1
MSGVNSARNYSQKMYDIWENKGYKNKKNGLIKTILSANKSNLIIAILISLVMVTFEFSLIYIFRELIESMDPKHTPIIPFMYLGITYFSVKLVNIMLNRQNAIFQAYLGFKSSVDLNCFIYTKLLKASPSSLKEKSKEGEIINFIQVDSNKLNMTMYLSPGILIIPIKIVVYSFMLFQFFGISFLIGFTILALSLTINFFIQKKLQQRYKEMYKLKDDRMRVTTETFNNLKVLKLYSWEDEFLNRINKARENEIRGFNRIFNLSTLSNTLLWSTPVLVSVASIGAYQYFVQNLKISDILSCIAIFNSIQEPIRMLPFTVNNLIECMVSLRRIEVILIIFF